MAHDLKNNLLDSFYYESFLPPLWQTLFHEGNRANHLLFPDDTSASSETEAAALTPEDEERLCAAVLAILTSNDVSKMREVVTELKGCQRSVLFRLYLRFLGRYREHFKRRLN